MKHTIGAVPGYFWLLLTLKFVPRVIVTSHVRVVIQRRKKKRSQILALPADGAAYIQVVSELLFFGFLYKVRGLAAT